MHTNNHKITWNDVTLAYLISLITAASTCGDVHLSKARQNWFPAQRRYLTSASRLCIYQPHHIEDKIKRSELSSFDVRQEGMDAVAVSKRLYAGSGGGEWLLSERRLNRGQSVC